MENFELEKSESIECNRDFILKNLGLIVDDDSESKNLLKLESGSLIDNKDDQRLENTPLDSPDSLFHYFENVKIIEPDKICRPKGDTTFFTTAGVQHIETILREKGDLKKEQFAITQPVIRSQFMDKVKDGTSTSFVNFSIEFINAKPSEFIDLCSKLIKLINDQIVDSKELKFQIEDSPDRWGDRKFTKTVLTVYFNNIELGECIYIHDYPVAKNEKINIADIGFGVERLNWGICKNKYYFPEFNKFYTKKVNGDKVDSNKITSIIDCARTATLIAGEGIEPSNNNLGYRLRQLSKRFVFRNQEVNIDITELIHISYEYWKKWGYKSNVSEDKIVEVIKLENERNYNSLLLSILEKNGGMRIYVDINQTTKNFLRQLSISLPKEAKEIINKIIKKTR